MAGYVRNDTSNNIATGNIINASDLDGEFDAIQAAFVNSTGHTHDGTTAEGAPITKVGPTQDISVSAIAATPKITNTVDLGSSTLRFKDLYAATGQFRGANAVRSEAASTQDAMVLAGRAGGTSSFAVTLTPTTLTASRTVTFPDSNTTIPIASQVITFSGPTTARTYTLPDSASTLAALGTAQTFTAAQTFRAASAVRSEAASTQDAVVLAGRAGGSSSFAVTLAPTTLASNTTLTLPNVNDTLATIGTAQTFTAAQTFRAANSVRAEAAATQDAIVLAGRAAGTSSFAVTLTPGVLTASRTVTFPDASTTVPVATQVITFSGPSAARTYTLPDSAQTLAALGVAQTFTAAQTFRAANAIRSEAASTQDAVVLAGRAGGTSSFAVTLTPTTLAANRTITLPDATTTMVGTDVTQTLSAKTITGLRETRVAMGANDVDISAGNYFTKTISGTTTFTVSNVPTSGTAASFILDLTNGGSATINWWSGVKWASGTAPTLTAAGRDVLGFFTHDGGTTWTGLLLGKDVK